MTAPAAADRTLQIILDRIVARFHPRRVILFGSQARGTATERSDIDLLVVFDHVTDKRRKAVELRRAVGDLPMAKDFVVTTPDEIARRGNMAGSVLRGALRDGRVLYERP